MLWTVIESEIGWSKSHTDFQRKDKGKVKAEGWSLRRCEMTSKEDIEDGGAEITRHRHSSCVGEVNLGCNEKNKDVSIIDRLLYHRTGSCVAALSVSAASESSETELATQLSSAHCVCWQEACPCHEEEES